MKISTKMRPACLSILFILALFTGMSLRTLPASAASGQLYMAPASQQTHKNQTFSVVIHEDSSTDAINGVQSNFNYPTSQLQVVSSTAGSGWTQVQNDTSTAGTILFAAFPSPPGSTLTGDKIIETVVFKAVGTGTANLSFSCNQSSGSCSGGNALTRSSDSADILTTTTGATITINPNLQVAVSADSGSATPRIVARSGNAILAKDGLFSPWAVETTGLTQPVQIFAAGDRFGYIDGNKNLVIKQGLFSPWTVEATGVDDTVLGG
jgi:hypothetical protein